MEWLERLKATLHRRRAASPYQWALEPEPHAPLSWATSELAALLAAEQEARLCYASCSDFNRPLQSVLLGFDLSCNQVLLDEFVPSPGAGLIDKELTLRLPMAEGMLHLELVIIEKVLPARHSALVGRIIGKSINPLARSGASICFSKGQSPKVELLLPMNPVLRGQVVELSANGLLLEATARAKPTLYTSHAECKIVFGSRFTLTCAAQLDHVSFHRKPYRHSRARLSFHALAAEQKQQLKSFIDQYQSLEHAAHRAA